MKSLQEQRNTSLATLGFASFEAFLGSDLWRLVHKSAMVTLRRAKAFSCVCCGNKNRITLFPTAYDTLTLTGGRPFNLAPVCRGCMRKITKDADNVDAQVRGFHRLRDNSPRKQSQHSPSLAPSTTGASG